MLSIRERTREGISDPVEREVTTSLLETLANDYGIQTFGDAVKAIDAAAHPVRRQLLDRARDEAELELTSEIDARREAAAIRNGDQPPPPSLRSGPDRDEQGFAWLTCSEPNCNSVPVSPDGEQIAGRVCPLVVPSPRGAGSCGRHGSLGGTKAGLRSGRS